MRNIEILVGSQIAKAVLLEENAPQTCKVIWNELPLGGDLHYAKIAGEEIFFMVPILLRPPIKKGKLTTMLETGSIVYYPNRQLLCIFYGPTKEVAEVQMIARIVANLEGIKEELDKVKYKQGKRILIRKA